MSKFYFFSLENNSNNGMINSANAFMRKHYQEPVEFSTDMEVYSTNPCPQDARYIFDREDSIHGSTKSNLTGLERKNKTVIRHS